MEPSDRIQAIHDFWFGEIEETEEYVRSRTKTWFANNSEFDQQIITQFADDYERAATGDLDGWMDSPHGCLSLVLLLDQFSRNMFRNDPKTWATDEKARAIAAHAIAQGLDQQLHPCERRFLYMPFMHSEEIDDQKHSVTLFKKLAEIDPLAKSAVPYAIKHAETIEQFGRFPYRNEVLGRTSTPEELEYLEQRKRS